MCAKCGRLLKISVLLFQLSFLGLRWSHSYFVVGFHVHVNDSPLWLLLILGNASNAIFWTKTANAIYSNRFRQFLFYFFKSSIKGAFLNIMSLLFLAFSFFVARNPTRNYNNESNFSFRFRHRCGWLLCRNHAAPT